jgi:hypothetical protein
MHEALKQMVYEEVTSVASFPDAEKAGNQPVYPEIYAQLWQHRTVFRVMHAHIISNTEP